MRYSRLLALAGILLLQGALSAQTITGTVTDAKTGITLHDANVILTDGDQKFPDAMVSTGDGSKPGVDGAKPGVDGSKPERHGKGRSTDRSGHFSFTGIPAGSYLLRVSFIGYKTFERRIEIGDRRDRRDDTQAEAGARRIRLDVRLESIPMPGPEIEVSAMKATARFSPVTFSDLKQQRLEDEYFTQDVPVMLSDLPSVTFYSEGGSGMGYNYLRIRGFDQRRLAVLVNGVPQNDPEDHNVYWIDLVDMLGNTSEIQVQRGGGSAFYGPPAIGGSINIITGDFSGRKGITVSTGGGSYNTQRYALAIGSGLLDDTYSLFARISRVKTDGYRDHSYMDAMSYYFAATRYDKNVTTRINVYGGPLTDGLVYYGLPKFAIKDRAERRKNYNYWSADENGYTWTQERRAQELEEFSQPHFELLNEWKISSRLTFNSALFYVIGQGFFDYDGTGWTDAEYYRMTPEYGFPEDTPDPANPIIRAYVDNKQVGWLPRIRLDHGDGVLTTGLELRRHGSLHWGRVQWAESLPEGLDPDRHYYEFSGGRTIAAAYVQEQYRLSPAINLLADVQYVFNRYSLFDEKFVGTDFDVDYHFLNPRLGVNYNLNELWNFYGNLSYTNREPRMKSLYDAAESGGGSTPQFELRPDGSYNFSGPLVKPEKLVNLELGTGLTGRYYKVLLNGYVMDFRDEIVKSGRLDRFGQPITGNADRTLHLGLEFAATFHPTKTLQLDINGLLSRSRLKRYTVYGENDEGAVEAVSYDGNRISGFPEQLANVKATWRSSGFTAIATWKYVGDQYTDNSQNEAWKVDPYNVINVSLGYRTAPMLGLRALNIRFAVNNLLDNLYAQSGEREQFFVAAERNYFMDFSFEI